MVIGCGILYWNMGGKMMESDMEIKTTYVSLRYPTTYKKYLKYEEILDGIDATEVFYMVYQDTEWELFRLNFTQIKPENPEGYFNTENGILYLSVDVTGTPPDIFTYQQLEEEEEEIDVKSLYYAMVDGVTNVLESVKQDVKYCEFKNIAENDKQDVKCLHWTVNLPVNLTWKETVDKNVEQVTFYGVIGEKNIELYTVSIGNEQDDSTIGYYVVNNEAKAISVMTNDISASEEITEDDKAACYILMDTINDVIQEIMSDSKFTLGTEE